MFAKRTLLLITFILSGCLPSTQPHSLTQDSRIIAGTLDNGFQYSLLTGNADDLTIILQVNTGSLDERDDQQGFAHLIEHMSLQGTENFSAAQIHKMYTDANMQLGPDINAFTYFDHTQYIVTLNGERANTTIAKPFIQWLADISNAKFTLNKTKLDIEKTVVLAEGVRLKANLEPGFYDVLSRQLLAGTKQADRMPIGKVANIEQATINQLNEFISQHYQPSNSRLIVIGKDADLLLPLIENSFSSLQVATAKPASTDQTIEINTENFFFSAQYADPFSQLILYHPKSDLAQNTSQPAKTLAGMFEDVLYNRIRSVNAKSASVFSNISIDETFLYDHPNSTITVEHNSEQHAIAINTINTELRRLIRFGILESEFQQLQHNWLEKLQHQKHPSTSSAALKLAKALRKGHIFSGFNAEMKIATQTVQQLNLSSFNQQLKPWIKKLNQQWAFSGAQINEKLLISQIDNAKSLPLLPPTERALPTVPVNTAIPGTVLEEVLHSAEGITQWTLSNGIQVIMQPRNSNTVSMLFAGPGGLSSVAKSNYPAARMAAAVYSRSGQNWIDDADLEKLLIDNKIDLKALMLSSIQGIELKASPEKLRLAFSLLNSSMHNAVVKESTFEAIKQNFVEEQLKFERLDDSRYLRDLARARIGNAQDYLQPGSAQYKSVQIEQLEALYQQMYQNAKGYVLAITGDFSITAIRPLVLSQIASLNTQPAKTTTSVHGSYVKPSTQLISNNNPDAQKAHLNVAFITPASQITIEERFKLTLLGLMLQQQLFTELREKQGLVYDVAVPTLYSDKSTPYHLLYITTTSDPKKTSVIQQKIKQQLELLRAQGFSAKQLQQAKKTFSKSLNNSFERDINMAYILATNHLTGLNYLKVLNFEKVLSGIDTAQMRVAIKQYLAVEGRQIGIFYQ